MKRLCLLFFPIASYAAVIIRAQSNVTSEGFVGNIMTNIDGDPLALTTAAHCAGNTDDGSRVSDVQCTQSLPTVTGYVPP